MGYKKHEPVSERTMRSTTFTRHHTICQTLREMFVAADELDGDVKKELQYKARLAMAMAKAMQNKLKEYKKEKEEWLSSTK